MKTYIQLQSQIEKLQKEAQSVRKRELSKIISRIKEAIKAYGLTAEDLGLAGSRTVQRGRKAETVIVAPKAGRKAKKARRARATKGGSDKRSVVAPKYRDSATGATWTGRGKQPKWLAAAISSGKKLEDFKI